MFTLFNPVAKGLEITCFEDLNLENALASGGKPSDPLNMLSYEIQSMKA